MADQIDQPGKAARVAAALPRRDGRGRFVATPGSARRSSSKPAKLQTRAAKARAAKTKANAKAKRTKGWRDQFLAKLAETSNISAACAAANVDTSQAYKVRRSEPSFQVAWRSALLEGYDNLELETLCRLREGELRTDERKFDIANALRLLKAHAETVAAERARREDRDEQDVLDSLDRMIESMRERAAANAAIVAEPYHDAV